MTHNQGVPGSCPGGPTQKRQHSLAFFRLQSTLKGLKKFRRKCNSSALFVYNYLQNNCFGTFSDKYVVAFYNYLVLLRLTFLENIKSILCEFL